MAYSRLPPFSLALVLLSLAFRPARPRTVAVDGVAQSEVPALVIGDSVVFKEVEGYDLYMFRSKRAFDLCMFAQARLLHSTGGNPSSHFTWHPSGPGNYYFSYENSSLGSTRERRRRVQVTVVPASALSPTLSPLPAPPPTAGDDAGDFFPSLPRPRLSTSPRPSPAGASLPPPGNGRSPSAAAPSAFPGTGNGIPFISSNPALPLPTGEADSATSRPLPVTGGAGHPVQVAGAGLRIQMAALLLSLAVACSAMWGHLIDG